MRQLNSFTFLTLNGFYKGPKEDTGWHKHGKEEGKFSELQLKKGHILLFGRKTYELMHSFWPTPLAYELFPKVAEGMNNAEKLVISNSLKKAEWYNTKILKGNIAGQIKKLKATKGKNISILGSGSIVNLLSNVDLIDEYEIMIDPLAIGSGTTFLNGLKSQLNLKLKSCKVFKSGVILLKYKTIRK